MGSKWSKTYPSPGNIDDDLLVWLSHENERNQIELLRNDSKIFHELDECEKYLLAHDENQRIYLVVNEDFARALLAHVHPLTQVTSIYIHSQYQHGNGHWSQSYPKVKAISTDMCKLIKKLHSDQQRASCGELPISLFDSTMIHQKLTRDLDDQLVHLPFLINTLIETNSIEGTREEFFDSLRHARRKKSIRKLERNYSSRHAMQSYLKNSFLSSMFHEALQSQQVDQIGRFRFFVHDMNREIKENRYETCVRTYRMFLLSVEQLENLQSSSIKFVSLNSFLITSMSKKRELQRFKLTKNHFRRVLFKFDADPRIVSPPFAKLDQWISGRSKEILFMIGSIFQIVRITQDKYLVTVNLRLCSSNVEQLHHLTEIDDCFAFGYVLKTIGQSDQARHFYDELLRKHSDDSMICLRCYENLAMIHDEKGQFHLSLTFYQKALNFCQNLESNRAAIYNSLGDIYRKMGEFVTAHKYFGDALKIWLRKRQTIDELFKIAVCYNHIGIVYQEENNFKQALRYYRKALEIREEHFQNDQISLGISCNNIGGAYYHLKCFQDAFSFYERALRIYQNALPAHHPKIASVFNNIAGIYEQRDNLEEALAYYHQAAQIYRLSYSKNHSNLNKIQINVDRVTENLAKAARLSSRVSRSVYDF